jgi:Flavin-binding monooxygenase-like.
VYFKDESSAEVDVIIQCTGYNVSFPFLPKIQQLKPIELYKFVYNPEDPSLSFVGFVRPIVGSIPGISEMNARWVCRVISGRVALAEKRERLKAVSEDEKFWFNYFNKTSHRISTLVEGYTYLDDVAKLSECYPDYWSLFKRNPWGALMAYFAPYNGCSYRLNEPEEEERALETLQRHSSDTMNFYIPVFILFMRLTMFDWFCDLLGNMKYKIQTNERWQTIREWRLIKLLDYLWCTPKRYLFDRISR